jgi:hypothetical protein
MKIFPKARRKVSGEAEADPEVIISINEARRQIRVSEALR